VGGARSGGVWELCVEDALSGDRSVISTRSVINCAGLHAHDVAARLADMPRSLIPHHWFAKGNYCALVGRSPFSRLVYPMPQDGGLGAHLTLDLGDPPEAKFGPDVEWLEGVQHAAEIDYAVSPARMEPMLASVRSYWPGVTPDMLRPAYSGVRVKLSGPGMPAADFCVQTETQHGVPGLANLFGIESPGLTSCLALGALVRDRLLAG